MFTPLVSCSTFLRRGPASPVVCAHSNHMPSAQVSGSVTIIDDCTFQVAMFKCACSRPHIKQCRGASN